MDDVTPIPDYTIKKFPPGQFNGLRAHYNIRTDPDLGMGWAALCRIACGCGPCKEQIKMPWVPRVDNSAQPRYTRNERCLLWPSYEGANDWKIFQLVPKKPYDEKGARESIQCVLNALEARVSLMMRIGEVGAVGTTDAAVMGYYMVKWLSEPYTLQEEKGGMASLIGTGNMVAKAVYFNRVQERAPYWYTLSGEHTIVEMRHVLRTGLHLQPTSVANKLPQVCNRMEATWQKALKVMHLDHDAIMEKASRCDRLEYDDDKDDESEEEESDDELAESDGDSE